MKQTAVEWLVENIPIRYRNALLNECPDIIQRAKIMEEERVNDAHNDGIEFAYNMKPYKPDGK
jgi:hypothetical protein